MVMKERGLAALCMSTRALERCDCHFVLVQGTDRLSCKQHTWTSCTAEISQLVQKFQTLTQAGELRMAMHMRDIVGNRSVKLGSRACSFSIVDRRRITHSDRDTLRMRPALVHLFHLFHYLADLPAHP